MATPQMIALDDDVLRDDLDPRLSDRDDDLIEQYADIFDALPPIEINQHNEVIDGWHRVRAAEQAKRTEIAYVVETDGDDDLADRMWESNLRHGVQYTRDQRQTHGLKLHGRGLVAKEIADRVGVSAATVRRWTEDQRERDRQLRNEAVLELAEKGKTQAEIAEETGVPQRTVSDILSENVQMRKTAKDLGDELPTPEEPDPDTAEAPADEKSDIPESISQELESEAEPTIESDEEETGETTEVAEVGERPVEEQAPELEVAEPETPETDETPAEEESVTSDSEPEPSPPEPIPDHILNTARAVMDDFTETRPDDYVAKLEASGSEWMTITDDSLSNELERELLNSAAAMCLWEEWMIWYQGVNASTFTDAFGKIGPVFGPRAKRPVEYCVKAQIDIETLADISLKQGHLKAAGRPCCSGRPAARPVHAPNFDTSAD